MLFIQPLLGPGLQEFQEHLGHFFGPVGGNDDPHVVGKPLPESPVRAPGPLLLFPLFLFASHGLALPQRSLPLRPYSFRRTPALSSASRTRSAAADRDARSLESTATAPA